MVLTIGATPFDGLDIGGNMSIGRIFYILTMAFATISNCIFPRKMIAMEKPIMLLILWAMITLLWSLDPDQTWYAIIFPVQSLFLVFVMINLIDTRKKLYITMGSWILGSLIICVMTILNFRTMSASAESIYRVNEYGNPNENSFILAYALLFAMYIDRTKFRVLAVSMLAICLYGIMSNGSRMGMILYTVLAASFIISLWQTGKKRYSILLIPVLLGIGIYVFQNLPRATILRFLNITNDIGNSNLAYRERIWEIAFKTLDVNPMYVFFGSGWGTFHDAIEPLLRIRYSAHNFYLDILMTSGIVGLSIVIWYLIILFKYICKTSNKTVYNYLMLFIPMMSMCSTNWTSRKWWLIMGALIFLQMIYPQKKISK